MSSILFANALNWLEYLAEPLPQLKILVTGREALFISGETTLQIPSLSLPAKGSEGVAFAEICALRKGYSFLWPVPRTCAPILI